MKCLAPILALAIFLAPPASAEAPVVAEARRVLADGAARLLGGDLRGAEGTLEEARSLADEAGEAALSIEVRLHLGEVFARSGRIGRGVAAIAEAISLAEAMEARGDAPPGPSVAVRVQLAEMLRAHGEVGDSEAAAWDALGRSVSLGRLDLCGPAVRLVVLAAVDQGATPEVLAALVVELDLALSSLDDYRLALPPPPEPIAVGLESLGRQLLESGQATLAAETLAALAALDAAREAMFRLPSDLARLATASSLAGDRARARWASDLALALQGERPTPDVLGAVCAVALEEERFAQAVDACERGAAAASGFAQAALTARRAAALASAGDLEGAQRGRAAAQRGFEALGALGDARVEQAERALLLTRLGRFEASGRELVSAVAGAEGTGAAPRVEEVRLRIALAEVLAGRGDEERAQAVLAEVGKWLFDAQRADDLSALAALHVDRALAAGDAEAAALAAEHAIGFERQLGLADEGWRALDARARVHAAAGRTVEAQADRREVVIRMLRWRRASARVRDPLFPRGPSAAIAAMPRPLDGPPSAALERDVGLRQPGLQRFGEPRPRGAEEAAVAHAETEVQAVRDALHAVSFRGSERGLDEVRAELEPRLRQARAGRDDALTALVAVNPRRAWLWGAAVEPSFVPQPVRRKLHVDVFCPESAPTAQAPAPRGRELAVLLAAVAAGASPPGTDRATLAELADLDLEGTAVTWPACASRDSDLRTAFWLAGAATVEPLPRPARRRR